MRSFTRDVARKTMIGDTFLVPIVLAVMGLAACSAGASPTPVPTSTPSVLLAPSADNASQMASAELMVKGAQLYTANCKSCHGDRNGVGLIVGAPPHNEKGHTSHHPDAQLKEWVLNGKPFGFMPGFGDRLAEDDTETILSFIKTWWTPEQRDSQADISERYQEALDRQKRGQ